MNSQFCDESLISDLTKYCFNNFDLKLFETRHGWFSVLEKKSYFSCSNIYSLKLRRLNMEN